MSRQPVLLIVDDEKPTREGLRLALEGEFDVFLAANLKEAESVLHNEHVDVLLTDLRLGSDNGMEVLDRAMALSKPPLAVMMTAYGSVDTAVEAMRRGAWHFVTKPLNLDEEWWVKQWDKRTYKYTFETTNIVKNFKNGAHDYAPVKELIHQSNPTFVFLQ